MDKINHSALKRLAVVVFASASAAIAMADVVTDWNLAMSESLPPGTPPYVEARS